MATPETPRQQEELILSGDPALLRHFYSLAITAGLDAVFNETPHEPQYAQEPHGNKISRHEFQEYLGIAGITPAESTRLWSAVEKSGNQYDQQPANPWNDVIYEGQLTPTVLASALHYTFGGANRSASHVEAPRNIGENALITLSFFHGNTREDLLEPSTKPSCAMRPERVVAAIEAYGKQLKLNGHNHHSLIQHLTATATARRIDTKALEVVVQNPKTAYKAKLHSRLYFGVIQYTKAMRQYQQEAP